MAELSAVTVPRRGQRIDFDARFQRAMELIGKRWTGCIIRALLPREARFNQLLVGIPGISDRVMTERLQELEREGLVLRTVYPGPPLATTYGLTKRGRDLWPVIAAVDEWAAEDRGGEHQPPVSRTRDVRVDGVNVGRERAARNRRDQVVAG